MTATVIALGTALAIVAAIVMAGTGTPRERRATPAQRRLSR